MSLLTVFRPAPAAEVKSLEQILLELTKHGRVRVGQYGSTNWHCSIEMNVPAVGASFNVCSTFDHPDPTSAAKQCAERVELALKR
jgi:hypothetical protein